MRAFGLNLFFLLVLLVGRSSAQQQDTVFSDIHEALRYPDKTENIFLDGDNNDDSLFFKNINKFKNLKSIYLINGKGNELSENVFFLTNLQQLYITSSPDIGFADLFDKLSAVNSLKILSINDCNLSNCPKEIRKIKSLQALVITDNDEFDTEELIKNISKLSNLKTLALPINQITDLPPNIGLLKQIEVLDISNNWLTDLPDEMPGMKSLVNLDISGNIIISPVNTLGKIKNLNIRYLNLDKGLTPEEKEKLTELFPNAQITENNIDFVDDSVGVNNSLSDSASTSSQSSVISSVETKTDSLNYGTFNVQKDQFKIYSLAYLHYASVFGSERFKNRFDSTIFDERYLDTNYCNNCIVQRAKACKNIFFQLVKNKQKEIWFNNIPSPVINKYFNELNAFRGMVWVYSGILKKRQFKKMYISTGFFKPKKKPWVDMRIYYNQADKMFTLELKDTTGFKKFTAYPKLPAKNNALENSQKQYTKRNARYVSLLDKRRAKFQKDLLKEKALYDKTLKKSLLSTWSAFQAIYMSDEEKKLSMSEWLEYYDNVVANEKRALYNADATVDNVIWSLESDNYIEAALKNIVSNDTTIQTINAYFKDEEDNLLVVSKILLINPDNKTYCHYTGSLGLDPTSILLSPKNPVAIVIELRNGDIGILEKAKYPKDKLAGVSEYTFTTKRISKKLGSVGQIIEILNL